MKSILFEGKEFFTSRALLLLLTLLSLTPYLGRAQYFSFDWVATSNSPAFSQAPWVSNDINGNAYCGGVFADSIRLNPASSQVFQTGTTNYASFLQKFDSFGNFIWGIPCPGTMRGMMCDDSGIYVTGYFYGSVDLDPGPALNMAVSFGQVDMFVIKYSVSGNYEWGFSLGNSEDVLTSDINIDDIGNVYVRGSFKNSMDFDPSSNVNVLTALNNFDIFILKLTPNGEHIWAIRTGGDIDLGARQQIKIDEQANLIIAGDLISTEEFGQGSSNLYTPVGQDIHVQKFDSTGQLLWVKFISGSNGEYIKKIDCDAENNIYLTGVFAGNTDFDPGPGIYTLPSSLSTSFFMKLDASGNLRWARHNTDNSNPGQVTDLKVLPGDESILVSGTITGTVPIDLDMTAGVATLPVGKTNYIMVIDSSGNYLSHKSFTSQNVSNILAMNLAEDGSLFVAGEFREAFDFDPSPNDVIYTSLNHKSHFLFKMTDCIPEVVNASEVACGPYSSPDASVLYDTPGQYTVVIPRSLQCDSVVHLDLTIAVPTSSFSASTECEEYTWIDGNTYTSSINGLVYIIPNTMGCDSTITLNLTILPTTYSTNSIVACNNYTWIDGNTYTSSNNTAMYTTTNAAGCDSVVNLNLIIHANTNTTLSGTTITSDAIGASYQWLDCDNGMAVISGETNQSFVAVSNGNYAVEVSENGCVDTSNCISITTVDILENTFGSHFTLVPNPTNEKCTIHFDKRQNNLFIRLRSISGQLLESYRLEDALFIEINLDQPSGVYLVEVNDDSGQTTVLRIIKE